MTFYKPLSAFHQGLFAQDFVIIDLLNKFRIDLDVFLEIRNAIL